MAFFSSAIKKAEEFTEKGFADVSDAIYATGNVVGKAGSAFRIHEALDSTENVADIMDTEEQEDQKIRMSARDALDKVSGKGKNMASMGCRKELGQLDTMLPLNRSTDVWREAQPVTKITDSLYPFGDDNDNKRPTVNELDQVYKVALGVLLNPINKEYQKELEPYLIQMFGKTLERHEGLKQSVALDNMPTQFKLHLKLVSGKNMISRDANGKSDPYCFITVVKSEHVNKINSDKHNMLKINETKKLGLKIEKSGVISKTLNPTWNEEFEFPLGKDPKANMILIEVWDSDETTVKLRSASIGNISRFIRDLSESDDFMGRAFMPLSGVSLTPREKTLTLYSHSKKRTYGEVTIQVQIVGIKPTVEEAKVLKDHSLLTAAVLDFESHMTGEYAVGWNTKITPLGYKMLSLNAVMNGITPLQQASILFPLLQLYDKHVDLSIIGYFGVVRTISLHLDQLPVGSQEEIEQAISTYPKWIQTLFKCMDKLDDLLVGVLRRHHQLFSFRTEEGIDYLTLHVELIKEMYDIRSRVDRLKRSSKNLKDTVYDACKIAHKSWFDNIVAEAIPLEPDVKKQLLCFLEVINHIIQRLQNAARVQAIFRETGIDYYTLLYVSIDQQVSSHVQDYTNHRITIGGTPSYQLYLQISEVIKLAENISPNDKPGLLLNGYHDWFKGFVGDWIDVASSKSNDEIRRAVTSLDKVVPVTENVKFSQSALSVAGSFKRITTFWKNLQWPSVSEHYAFMVRVVEIVSKAARFYVEESHKNLKRHDYFMVNFIVTQELCISLNDIQYVREELLKTPEVFQFDALISRLAAVEGDQHAIVARKTLENLISSADEDVNSLLKQVASSVSEEMSSDIATHINTIMKSDPSTDLVQVIDPLMQYLTKNLGTFHNLLLHPVLEIMIEETWNITIHGFVENVSNRVKQQTATRLLETIKQLESFFHAGGDGLPVEKMKSDEYKKVYEILIVRATTDEELIGRHLNCLAEWSRSGDKKNGQLSFSVGYIQSKETLEVTVIKGTNLPALDSNGLSDPYVQIVLMPERRFQIKPVETDHKSKDLNPTYYKEFDIGVKENLLDMPGSVLTLTVYDHDFITKDDFAGMVVIEGKEIPRLPGGSSSIDDPNAPQRKTYELPLVPNTMTPALEELAERNHKYVNEFKRRHRKN